MTQGHARSSAPLAAIVLGLAALIAAGCSDSEPNTPIAQMATPSGLGGSAVPITYILRNDDTTNASIEVLWEEGGRGGFRDATRGSGGEGISALRASPGGTTHIFVWNALADLGAGRHSNVVLRIVPSFGGETGTTAETFAFTLDNTNLFLHVPDLALSRDRAGAAALPDDGVLVAGGGLSGVSEGFDPLEELARTRDSLKTAREGAPNVTALVLVGGRAEASPVIVCGTGAGGVTLSSVERYDPGEDEWVDTGLDAGERAGHTVTRLQDGRLLVAGGGPSSDVVLDLRDPAAATLSAILSGADRTGHAAALLPDGRVLISGGTRLGAPVPDSLLYTPDAPAYAAGPPLVEARTGHASALAGSRVVVCGGRNAAGAVTSSAEVADASLGAFVRTTGTLTIAREAHTATGLSDGTVLVVGGSGASGTSLASAERYIAPLDLFLATRGALTVARRGHQATPFGAGRVLITGGGTESVELYLSQSIAGSSTFDPIASPAAGRAEHAVTALSDGRALVTGGTDGVLIGATPTALASAALFNPKARTDERLAPLVAPLTAARRLHSATLLADGRVLLAGGIGADGASLASLEVFTASDSGFSPLAATLAAGLSEHTATRLSDGRVLIAGGRPPSGGASGATLLFEPSGGTITALAATLQTARRRHTATLLPDGRVLLAGGLDASGDALASAEVFDAAGPSVTPTAQDLPLARFGHASLRLSNGTVIIAGGRGGSESDPGTPTADVRRFDPASMTFTALAPMLVPRAEMAAFTLSKSRAVFAGGVVGAAPPGAGDEAAPVTASAEVYSSAGGGSSVASVDPDISSPRRGIGAATISGGAAILIGGRRQDATTTAGGERFSP